MSDKVLLAEPYGSMLFSSEVPCLIVQWHSFANKQQFCSLMDRGLALYAEEAKRTQPLGWLADTQHVSAVNSEVQQWLHTDWNPRAYAAGIRHVGFVMAETVFGQISVQTYSGNTQASSTYSIETAVHPTLSKAKRWLHHALQA